MNRRSFFAVGVGALAASAGCGRSGGTSSVPSGGSDAKLVEELEADMANRLNLESLKLAAQGGGRFTGKGKDRHGQDVDVEVTLKDGVLSWKNSWNGPVNKGGGSGSAKRTYSGN